MITITIDEHMLLKMFLDRVEYWTKDETILDLYKDYYEELVYSGCFEGCKLDITSIVDDDYINNLTIISKKDFEQWDIESEVDDSIITFNEEKDLYLIGTY
jgi:hypothetical protein